MLTNRAVLHTLAFTVSSLSFLTTQASAQQKKANPAATPARPSYEAPQPDHEKLDQNAYLRIREEGISHSHVMEYASGLMDGIAPASPVRRT